MTHLRLQEYVVALLASCGLCTCELAAQTIRGKVAVLDIADPIPNAVVFLLGAGDEVFAATVADSSGHFEVRAPKPGTFVLRVHRFGYMPARSDSLTLTVGRTIEVRVNMRPDATVMEGVTIYGSRLTPGQAEFQLRKENHRNLSYLYGREEIDRLHAGTIGDVLRSGVPFHVRCPQIYVDGWPTDKFALEYPLSWVYGIEVYPFAIRVPKQYRKSAFCGAILIWSTPIRRK